MIVTKKLFAVSACAIAFVGVTVTAGAQTRDRVVKTTSSRPTNLPVTTVQAAGEARPTLTNDVRVVQRDAAWEPLVEKTASNSAAGIARMIAAGQVVYGPSTSIRLDQAIRERYGIRYRYGSSGPNTYDCSGFVWAAFRDAGIDFTRTSARAMWAMSEPVSGDDRFKFGTLIFLNGLGHMGIVADENGFYHASSSKGITYSPFMGYWANRIVGFRRLNTEAPAAAK